jgi:hypothetical protein
MPPCRFSIYWRGLDEKVGRNGKDENVTSSPDLLYGAVYKFYYNLI